MSESRLYAELEFLCKLVYIQSNDDANDLTHITRGRISAEVVKLTFVCESEWKEYCRDGIYLKLKEEHMARKTAGELFI